MKKDFTTRQTLIMRANDPTDEKAWEDFVYYYEDYIDILLSKFFLTKEDKQDLRQDILLALWKNLKSYDSEKALFRTWLTRIVRNAVINKIKKSQLRKKLNQVDLEEKFSPSNINALEEIFEKEWINYVSTLAFERIKPLFSSTAVQVFDLALDNMSIEEIAKKLDISRDSAYKMRARVVKKLQDEIKNIRADTAF